MNTRSFQVHMEHSLGYTAYRTQNRNQKAHMLYESIYLRTEQGKLLIYGVKSKDSSYSWMGIVNVPPM